MNYFRKSLREYDKNIFPTPEDIVPVIKKAYRAPMALDAQNVKITVVTDPLKIRDLSACDKHGYATFIKDAPMVLVVTMKDFEHSSFLTEKEIAENAEDFRIFDHVNGQSFLTLLQYLINDTIIEDYYQLGSCQVSIFDDEGKAQYVRTMMGLKDYIFVHSLLAIGVKPAASKIMLLKPIKPDITIL